MSLHPQIIEFDAEHSEAILAAMEELADGSGWINLRPSVDPEQLPPNGGRPGILSAVGPLVPLCTWTPAKMGRRPTPPLVGIQHAAGGKAKPHLIRLGAPVPEGWRIVQDESRRGLVVAVPPMLGPAEVLAWLMHAGAVLWSLPFDGWVATGSRRKERAG